MGVSDKDMTKYKFALIQVATFKQPSYIEDGKFCEVYALSVADEVSKMIPFTIINSLQRMFLVWIILINQERTRMWA